MVSRPRLPEDRMLVEQLRLQLGNIGSSVIPTILLALLLVWVLSNETNALAIRAWAGLTILFKLYLAWDAQRLLAMEISPEHARRLLRRKMVINAFDGALWGSLAWAATPRAPAC